MSDHSIVIIGSGPAGCTAAIYAARAELNPVVIEGIQPGGQLTITTEVDNFPGFAEGIMGPALMQAMRAQAERFGTEFLYGHVTAVDLGKRPFTLTLDEEKEITMDALIVATGASARLLGLESEKALMGHGVSACATCDGFFFKGKEICVVGGGDTAVEEAIFLTKFASKVTVIHRRDELRASKIMRERAMANPVIDFQWNSVVEDVVGTPEEGVSGVRLKNVKTGEVTLYPTQGLFIAIGHKPNTELFKGKLEMNPQGYLLTYEESSRTSVEGVFASGDVCDPTYRQAITAAGQGCRAAIDAERWLASREE